MYICSHSIYDRTIREPYLDDISLNELKNIKKNCKITFDDGYLSIYRYRKTLYNLKNKIILFICPGFIEGDSTVWWFELFDYIFKNNNSIINFSFKGKNFYYDLNSDKQKDYCYQKLSIIFKNNSQRHHEELLDLIIKNREKKDYRKKFLNWEMIKTLSESANIIIGSHTYSHLNLKNETSTRINFELKRSKEIIEKYIKKECKYFAFPYGGKNSFNEKIINQVFEMGYKYIFTTEPKFKLEKNKQPILIDRITSSTKIKNNNLSLYSRYLIKLLQNISFR